MCTEGDDKDEECGLKNDYYYKKLSIGKPLFGIITLATASKTVGINMARKMNPAADPKAVRTHMATSMKIL